MRIGRFHTAKHWRAFAAAGLIAAAALVGSAGCASKEKLYLYSWADNFDAGVLDEFERKFGVSVRYDTFSNNEELLAKIQAGGARYDLIQPSDYMVATMIRLGLLEKLDKNNIPNLQNVGKRFLNPVYDPNNDYSVIYTWGITGIAYNKKYVTDLIDSWQALWDPKYKGKLILLDDSREVLGMALKKLGYSNSTQNESELAAAYEELKKLLPNVQAFDTDNIKQKMASEEGWIALMWSGDAALAAQENPNIAFVVPKEGTTIWADNYAIPKGARHKALAESFINYMLEPEVSAKNYESIGYSNPNEKSYPLHSKEYRENRMIFPTDEELARTEWLVDVGEKLPLYDRYWTELKSGARS
mgnify:FL=1